MTKFYTLGPTGSCHENALYHYLRFQNIDSPEVFLFDDLVEAAEIAASDRDAYVLQCSAHLNVHIITERFYNLLPVVDTFIFPTQPIALVKRKEVTSPRRIGLPEPTLGYINASQWEEIIYETTKPVVEKNILAGQYEAGIAYVKTATKNPEKIEIMEYIGEVVTSWILYGPRKRYSNSIIASPYPELHTALL